MSFRAKRSGASSLGGCASGAEESLSGTEILRLLLIGLIVAYQYTLSPDHGLLRYFFHRPVCRYTPTCSQYAIDAITKYGIFRGSWIAITRIARCTPWHPGGHDPFV